MALPGQPYWIILVLCHWITCSESWGSSHQAFYEKYDMTGVPFTSSVHKVTTGDSAILHCSFDAMPRQYMLLYGYDSLLLEWVKVMPDGKGKLLAVGSRLRTLEPRYQVIRVPGHKALSILVIRDVRHEDSGKYRCHLSLATMRHRYFQLDVLDPSLSVTHNDTSLKMKEGKTLTLHCNTTGYPPPMVHWTRRIKNGNNQWATGEYFVWGNTAVVASLHSQDSGIYSCHIDNFVSRRLRIDFNVQVAVKPQFLKVYQNGINLGGLKSGPWWPVPEFDRPFTLMCQTQAKSPTVILWYKNGRPLSKKQKRGHNMTIKEQNKKHRIVQSEIFFRQFQKTDLGTYLCRAQNPAGSLQYTFRLDSMKGYNYPWYKRPGGQIPKPTGSDVSKKEGRNRGLNADNEDSDEKLVGSGDNDLSSRYTPAATKAPPEYTLNKIQNPIKERERENETEKDLMNENDNMINDNEDDGGDSDDLLTSGDGSTETMNEIPSRDSAASRDRGSGFGPMMADEGSEAKLILVNKTKNGKEEMYI